MRVLQLVDTLQAGGAERMAVAIANGLAERNVFSALAVTRSEGVLKPSLGPTVAFLNCGRKRTLDFAALERLAAFVLKHQIQVIHAHGTSFFMATLLKWRVPGVRIVWHEHFGARSKQGLCENWVLFLCVRFFFHVLTVTPELAQWVKRVMRFPRSSFVPNFPAERTTTSMLQLHGEPGRRIIMVANLKKPKNHLLAVTAFHESGLVEKGWTLHFVGRDFEDGYSALLKAYLQLHQLEASVFMYGEADATTAIAACEIGLLTSDSEGFPVTLLEYAQAGLGVITSDAGFASGIVQQDESGFVFDVGNSSLCSVYLKKMAGDADLRRRMATQLKNEAQHKFSADRIFATIMGVYGFED